jgi:hypothetical protein
MGGQAAEVAFRRKEETEESENNGKTLGEAAAWTFAPLFPISFPLAFSAEERSASSPHIPRF